MEPRAVERFTDAMSEEQVESQTLTPYALDRATGFYVKVRNKVRNLEGLLSVAACKYPTRGLQTAAAAGLHSVPIAGGAGSQ